MKQKYLFSLFFIFCLINSYSQVNGDFRSTASGNWESASSWETWSGGAWIAASNYPGQIAGTYSITIQTAHTITVSSNLNTTSIGDLTVNGTLDLQAGTNPKQISLSTTLLYLTSTGILNFSNQKTKLYLPTNAVIKVDSGGNISGACSNNTEIYIDNKLIAVCNGGGGNVLTFGEIVAGSGTLNANITSPASFTSTICNGVSISLSGGYTGTPNGTVNYLWSVKDPSNTAVVISNSTLTSTSFTPSQAGQYTISFTVTDGSSFSNTETKTVTVQSVVGSGSIATAQTICSGTSPSPFTSTTDGTGDGTITYEWQTNASGIYVTIGGATAATYSPAVLTATTSYKRRTVSTLNGVACYSAYTTPVTITVGDTTPPVLTAEANQNATLNASCIISIPNLVDGSTATDNCSGITITQNPLAGTTQAAINNGTINVTVTATDTAGNTDSKIVIITAKDTTIPTLTAGVNQTANTAAGLCTASVAVTNATFSDNCSGSSISYSLSGATIKTTTAGQVGTFTFNKGVTTINYTVTDATGNTTTDSKTVTVTDNIFPTLTAGANQNANTDAGLCTSAIAITDATFSDNCTGSTISYSLSGATITATTSGQIGTFTFNKGVTTINYTVTDAVGNTITGSKTVTVTDNISPTITAGANQTANTAAGFCTASVAVTDAVFSDNCTGSTISYSLSGATIKVTTAGQVGTYTFNKGVTTINYTVTDAAGNTIIGSKTVTVTDNISPTITSGANQTANTAAGLCTASVAVTDATFSDNCTGSTISYSLSGATITATTSGQVGTFTFNKGITTINYTVTDAAGNTIIGSKTITVTDNINPTITAGANQTANTDAGLCTSAVAITDASFSDNCTGSTISYSLTGATIASTTSGQVGTFTFNKGITTINYTVTDAAGNTITGLKTVTVTDNINPTISAPATINANTNTSCTATGVNLGTPVTGDNCLVASVTNNHPSTTYPLGTTTVIWTVTDSSGNTATANQIVTVTDNVVPTISCSSNIAANVGAGTCTASVVTANPTTSDNCSVTKLTWALTGATTGTSAVTGINNLGTKVFNLGTTTVTYTVYDAANNSTSCSYTVTINDNINPTISCPSNVPVNVGAGTCTATVNTTNPTTGDNCSVTKLTWTLTGATTGSSALTGINNLGTQVFNLGTTNVSYTAYDAANNSATCSYTVTVTDNINPTISCPANINANVGAGTCTASVATTNPITADNCSVTKLTWALTGATTGTSAATGINNLGTQVFNLGTTTVTYTAYDAANRNATCSYNVTVTDNINPTISCLANINANVGAGTCTASVVTANPTTSDNCSVTKLTWALTGATTGTSAVTGINNLGTKVFNLGTTTVTYTVYDAANNSTSCSYTVTINDNINPTISCPSNVPVNVGAGSCTATVNTTNPTTADNCSVTKLTWALTGATTGTSAITGINNLGTQVFNLGVTTVTYTAYDAANNSATCSYTVTVTDNINPTISCGSNLTANVGAGTCTASVATTNPTTADNCSVTKLNWALTGATTGTSAATGINNLGTQVFNLGTTTITYTAYDAANRSATCSYNVTVNDNIAPTVSCPSNVAVNVGAGTCTASVVTSNPTTADNCSVAKLTWALTGATTGNSAATGINNLGTKTFNLGTTTVNYTVYDAANNSSSCSYTVIVTDNIDPAVIATSDIITTTSVDGTGNCTAAIAITNASTSDNCTIAKLTWSMSGATTANSSSTGINQIGTYTFNTGTTTIVYTVTDGSGRTSTDTMLVTVNDNEKPTAPSLPNITAQCSVTVSYPVATDNCSGTVTTTTGDPTTYNTQGSYIIHWSFKDSSGNETLANQNVIVDDTTAPVPNVTNLTALNVSGCQLTSLTAPTATDNCIGSITGTPSISLPFTTQGTTVITWTYDDGNGNTKTQTQNLTLTAPPIDGGSLLGYLSEIETQANAKDNIAITSCPDDINPITFNLSGQIGTIIQWEKFEAGNNNWQIIPNTTNTYSFVFDFQNTKSTLFRVLVQVGDCTKYSNMVDIHAIPPDVPPILEVDNFTICLNDNITLVAHNGYTSASAADDGGDFNSGQFPNKWDPTQWKIDGKTAGAQWTAAGNNTKFNNWAGTNNHPVGTLYRIEYDSNDLKFGIAHGNYNSPEYIAAYPPGNPTTLETPIFSLVGLKTASIDFDQAYNLHAGDIAKLELSLDGGVTYTVTLQNLIGTSPHALSWGDTHGTPVPYPYQAPKSNNSTTTYFDFQNDNSSFDISDYIGNDNVRVKWTFFGTTDESAWAVDNITIPVKPYSDQLEWTDGIGDPNTPPLASGSLDVTYTFAPTAPGVHQYGATSIINGCRAYDPSGTAIATVNVNYSYAGQDIAPTTGKCGGTTVTLNAYDNTKTANENKTNGAYSGATNTFSDDPGTGQIGSWSVFSSTSSCGTGSFSNINDPKATFTGAAGTYVLRWTVAGCADDVQVILENCEVIDFDGENDFVNFGNNYNLNSSFSINVWVKPEPQSGSGTNIQTIFSKRNGDNLSTTNGYDIRLDNNNYISFNWNAGGSLKTSHPISTSRWYHISVTFNGSTYKLYIDGLEVGTTSGSQPVTNGYDCLLGGMYHNANTNDASINFYNGWMDELQIWDMALTPDQIHQIMNQKIEANGTAVRGVIIPIDIYGLTWANLQGYYRMDNLNCGYLKPYGSKGVDGRLMNINTTQSKTAPLPYTTIRDGNWKDRGASTTPWLYGDSVWDYPNSTGINGKSIDWNIVVQSNNLNSDDKDITLLGLISNTGTKLKVVAPGTENENNSGHLLWLTHYLKLNGFIDLIGESQLLQKRYYSYPQQYSESIFDEASSGYIERDQQGNKNSYNYNYWSSPVSIRGGANNSAYTISSILRDGTDSANPKVITFGDGAYFADGALSSPIKISNRWIWTYNSLTPDSNSNWQNYYQWQYKAGTGVIPVAEGFTMKGTGGTAPITSLQNYVFTGKPNSGTINKFLAIQQTYLVGNPYPSTLDADEFIKDNLKDCVGCRGTANAFGGALYFWDHFGLSNNHILAQYEGGYATYTLTGGVRAVADDPLNVNDNSNGTKIPQRYIPVGQGFFIDCAIDPEIFGTGVTLVGGGMVSFNNSQRAFVRETSGNSIFMKTTNTKNTAETNTTVDNRMKIRLGFDSPIGSHRQILVGTDPNTTNKFDFGYDAKMIDVNKNDMYWELGKTPLIIQGIPNFNSDQIIPIGIKVENEGQSKIKIDALENIPNSLDIYLYDNVSKVYHDLRKANFSISLPAGTYNNRFSLQFADKLNSIDNTKVDKGIIAYYTNENKTLNIKNYFTDVTIKSVSLYNILKQNIANWEITDGKQNYIQLPVKNLSISVYIVNIKTDKGEFNQKIIIK